MAYMWKKKLLHNWIIPDSDPSAATKEGTEPYGNMEGCKPNMETLHSDMYVKQKNNDDIIMPPLTWNLQLTSWRFLLSYFASCSRQSWMEQCVSAVGLKTESNSKLSYVLLCSSSLIILTIHTCILCIV